MESQKIPQILGFVINGKIGVFFASPKHTSAWKTFRARSARNEARLTRMWWSCRLEADHVFAAMGWSSRNCPPSKGISMLVLAPAWQDVTKCCLLLWYASFVRLAESLIIQAKPMLLVRSRFLLQLRHETYLESPGLYYMIMERPLSSWMDNAIKGVK